MRESKVAGAAPATTSVDARPSPPRLGHRVALDGMRAIAVALVVLGHSAAFMWPEAGSWLAPGGPLGVHLFFVLSGFLITSLLLTEAHRTGGVDLAGFVRRRAVRLVPALVPLLGALAVVAGFGSRLDLADVWNSALHVLTFSTNYAMVHGEVPVIGWLGGDHSLVQEVGHTWSLSVEVHFYAVWAVTLWLVTRARWSLRQIAVLIVGAMVVIAVLRAKAYAADDAWALYYYDSWPRMDAPAAGALAAVAFAGRWAAHIPGRLLAWCGGAGLVAFLVAAARIEPGTPALTFGLYTVLALCVALAILAVLMAPEGRLARCLSWGPVAWLGTISYSLYLWHYWIFMVAARRGSDWPVGLRWVSGMTLAIGVAWASHRLVERPFLRRRVRPIVAAPVKSTA